MIELTEQQLLGLAKPDAAPPLVVNPQTKQTFVLVPVEEYEELKRLRDQDYDDGLPSREELQAFARKAAERGDWPDYGDYDAESASS